MQNQFNPKENAGQNSLFLLFLALIQSENSLENSAELKEKYSFSLSFKT